MFAEIPLFPEQASTSAQRVDGLLFFLLGVSGFFSLLIAGLVIFFSVKYRRRSAADRPPRITGSIKLEIFWSVVPLGITLVMFFWGASVFFHLSRPPDNALEVYVVGKQWMWKMQHPDGQREINELHVPIGQPVKLILTSEDVIHDFFVPAFRTKVDVLPGRYVQTWFQATKTGQYHLFCSQYCGTNHSGMVGTVIVQEPTEYYRWLNNRAEGSLALEGRKLFLKYQCVSCHSADAGARGPVLEGLFGRQVHLQNGQTVLADETYIRESILKPDAKIVAGFEAIMPPFQGQINEDEIIALIAFIKALAPGQTPPRIERAAPPADRPNILDIPVRQP
ncbi:MAG TPA: cytochrome c oxidase subunit II [Gemmataceae bacterium]|nr:cytochrome c oxidase subunit II [Gemmataceae bacterium]